MRFHILLLGLAFLSGCATNSRKESISLEHSDCSPQPVSLQVSVAAKPHLAPKVSGSHPVDFYVRAALAANPEIRARERRVAAQGEVIPQVTSLPDPMLGNTLYPIPSNSPQTAAGRVVNVMTLSQQFPWFGKLQLRGQVAEREVQIALTELAETQLKVIEGAKAAYYELAFNQRAIKITEENKEFLISYIKLATARYKVGKSSQQDVLRAEVELRRLEDQLVRFRRQLKVAQADMARLLSISPESELRASEDSAPLQVPQQLEKLYQMATASRPELQGRMQTILREQDKTELANLQYYPDITLGLNWWIVSDDDALARSANGRDNIGLYVSLNLPVWKDKLSAGVREAQARRAESELLYQSARDDVLRFVKRYSVQAQALQEQIDLYRKEKTGIIAKAEQTLTISRSDYAVGKVDALQVLDNWRQLLLFRVQLARLETALGQILASLERAVGKQLTSTKSPKPLKIKDSAFPKKK